MWFVCGGIDWLREFPFPVCRYINIKVAVQNIIRMLSLESGFSTSTCHCCQSGLHYNRFWFRGRTAWPINYRKYILYGLYVITRLTDQHIYSLSFRSLHPQIVMWIMWKMKSFMIMVAYLSLLYLLKWAVKSSIQMEIVMWRVHQNHRPSLICLVSELAVRAAIC